MAISLEELAVGALEGSVGPWSLAVGASALAVALAAGSMRPLQRIAATSVVAADRAGRFSLKRWIGAARRGWAELVDEARAEYEAGRRPGVDRETKTVVVASASGFVSETDRIVVPATVVEGGQTVGVQPLEVPPRDQDAASRTRDQRGRFVRRRTNGARPE
jgi:hypothetical protein